MQHSLDFPKAIQFLSIGSKGELRNERQGLNTYYLFRFIYIDIQLYLRV